MQCFFDMKMFWEVNHRYNHKKWKCFYEHWLRTQNSLYNNNLSISIPQALSQNAWDGACAPFPIASYQYFMISVVLKGRPHTLHIHNWSFGEKSTKSIMHIECLFKKGVTPISVRFVQSYDKYVHIRHFKHSKHRIYKWKNYLLFIWDTSISDGIFNIPI